MKNKNSTAHATKTTTPATAPKMPDTATLAVTDPKRKLTRAEFLALTPEQKAERKQNKRAARGSHKQRIAKSLLRQSNKLEKIGRYFSDASDEAGKELFEQIKKLVGGVRIAVSDVDSLPDSWVPSGRRVRIDFTPGMVVRMVDGKREKYEETLGEKLGDLKVVRCIGRKVVVQTDDGLKMFLPVGHVKQIEAAKSN